MVKMVMLLKRKPGMSMTDFIAYYESTHRLIGEKYLKPHATRYVRRFLFPLPDPQSGQTHEADHDVLLEIWFPDQTAYEAGMSAISQPEAAAEISEDEEKLFDRATLRAFTLQEHESDMTVQPG